MAFTPDEINDFRNAIKTAATDLFFGLTATYQRFEESTDTWEEDNIPRKLTEYQISVLQVFADDTDGEVEITKNGVKDLSEGYILINYQDAETANMIDTDGNFIGNPALDKIKVQNITFDIIGINLLGQFVDKFSLIKIQVRKRMR